MAQARSAARFVVLGCLTPVGGPDPEGQLRMASEVLWAGRQCLGAP
jgi:hypothetical protein